MIFEHFLCSESTDGHEIADCQHVGNMLDGVGPTEVNIQFGVHRLHDQVRPQVAASRGLLAGMRFDGENLALQRQNRRRGLLGNADLLPHAPLCE